MRKWSDFVRRRGAKGECERDITHSKSQEVLVFCNEDSGQKMSAYTWGYLFLLTIAFTPAVYADTDLWWHLRAGADLLISGRYSEYSYLAPVADWINHEWLWELVLAKCYLLWGFWGLAVLRAGLLFIAGLIFTYQLRDLSLALTLTLSAAFLFTVDYFFNHQAGLVSLLFFGITVLLCQRIDQKKVRLIVPLLFLLWANLHAGFVAGLLVLAIVLVEKRLKSLLNLKRACLLFTSAVAATLINPYGHKLWRYICKEMLAAHTANGFWLPLDTPQMTAVISLLGMAALLKAFVHKNIRGLCTGNFALLIIFSLAAIRHQRMLPFFLMLLLWQTAPALDWLFSECKNKALRASVPLTALLACYGTFSKNATTALVGEPDFPIHSAQYLATRSDISSVMAPFDWGGYILWKAPHMQVGFDGRYLAAFDELQIEGHINSILSGDLQTFIASSNTQSLLIRTKSSLYEVAQKSADWQVVFQDKISTVFIKTGRDTQSHS